MQMIRAAARSALAVCLLALLGGCTGTAAQPAPPAADAASGARAGLIDLADGRRIHLACLGSGEPLVLLVSGTGGAADEWMVAADPADPAAAPRLSGRSVFEVVARTTRVCAYDRPGTTDLSGRPTASAPVAQPTDAGTAAADLHLLRAASGAGVDREIVLVGASWGGLIAQAYVRTHPHGVAGLVLVDSASTHLADAFTPAQWNGWMAVIAASATGDAESPDYPASLRQLAAAPPVPPIPTTVLSSDREWDLAVDPSASTWPGWLAAQTALAAEWRATRIADTGSGHGIHVEQPQLVADAILALVREARAHD